MDVDEENGTQKQCFLHSESQQWLHGGKGSDGGSSLQEDGQIRQKVSDEIVQAYSPAAHEFVFLLNDNIDLELAVYWPLSLPEDRTTQLKWNLVLFSQTYKSSNLHYQNLLVS